MKKSIFLIYIIKNILKMKFYVFMLMLYQNLFSQKFEPII